jgi:DNA-directed RNA polymerase specialized sigma24 family protein
MSHQSPPMSVEAALDRLSPIERAALDLIYREGLTQVQVATRLRLTESSVRSTVGHAMCRLGWLLVPCADD